LPSAGDDGAEDDRRDQHLHQIDETIAEGLHLGAEVWEEVADGDPR
jgi:hypothetical protein